MEVQIYKQDMSFNVEDVIECCYDGYELSLIFNKNHKYTSMEEIIQELPICGNYNFRFKGVDMWYYDDIMSGMECYHNGNKIIFDDNKETSIIAVLKDAKVVVLP